MFEKAKQLREAVREEYKQKSVDPYTENIFKGKIFCAHCGKPLHRCHKKCKTRLDTYSFYCLANSRIAKGVCVGARIYENEVIEGSCARRFRNVRVSVLQYAACGKGQRLDALCFNAEPL